MQGDPIPKAALPAPPFAVPTWVRPVISTGGSKVLAGGQATFDFVDVVQADLDGYIVCRMDVDRLLDIADDRNACFRIIFDVLCMLCQITDIYIGISIAPRYKCNEATKWIAVVSF